MAPTYIQTQEAPNVTQRPFSPPSFPARRKRRGRRRRVRNDHDGTSRRKRRLFSSVLVSSFPNRKLNLRFGSFPADLRQPLSLGCAETAPLSGEPRGAHRRRFSELGDNLSVSFADSIPTPFVPSGHFPLIGGIGPWKGSQGVRTAGGSQNWGTTSQSAFG